MTWLKCTCKVAHKRIKLSDPGSKRHAVFKNDQGHSYEKTQSDGCWIVGKTAADWVLTKTPTGEQVIVELKGKDVDHACEQILATAFQLRHEKQLATFVAGLIVCTEYPRANTKIQRAQALFAKLYKGPIHAVTKSREFSISRVVAFDGPG